MIALVVMILGIAGISRGQSTPAHFSSDLSVLYERASQIPPSTNADVVILENDETLTFSAEGRALRSRYLLYKVLTEKGAEGWADVSLTWQPWHEERPSLRARVITSDKTVHTLDEKTVTDSPAKESQVDVFSDERVIRAPLPAVAPGAIVEEELISHEAPPFSDSGIVERFYFGGSVPVEHTRLVLDAPPSLPIRYLAQSLPELRPQRSEAKNRVEIVFDYGWIDPVATIEPGLPSDVPGAPSVIFSTGGSWREIAEEYGKIIDSKLAGSDLKDLVTKLVAGKNSRDEKTVAILQYLDQEVRYTGVEFGAATVVPHSPSETLNRKYGDCKDKAALLVAMLRTANIPAYVALLNAGNREDLVSDFPGMGMFDHAIVYVPGPPDLWIDATDKYARPGEIPIADQERFALIVRPGSDALSRTPGSSSAANLLIEKRDIYLAENGPARIIEISQPHGSIESSYRNAYADKQSKDAENELAKYVESQYLAAKLDRFDRSDPSDLSKQFELILESDHARRGFTGLDLAVAAIRYEGLFSRLPEDLLREHDKGGSTTDTDGGHKPAVARTSDYELPEAFVTEWDYTIHPPEGFRPKDLPQDAKILLGPSVLTEQFTADSDGVVHAVIRFDTGKRRLTASEAAELGNKVTELSKGKPLLVYFEPVGQTLIAQGKTREAIQFYRGLIALRANDAIPHLRIAKTFLAAGLGEAARNEAMAGVKLEPQSALAQKTLGEILEYDLVGRQFRPGSDYAGAEAAFRAAENIDPEDQETIVSLAVLLEHNRWGLRYGPGAKLKEALAEYHKLTADQLAELGLQNNVPFALFYAGEFSEAQKSALDLNPEPTALIVACEAALHGTQAALAEANKRTSGQDQLKQAAKTAGDMLVNIRKYSLAADLEEAGASGESASETAAYASLYRKTEPHEQLVFHEDPTSAAMRFLVYASDPDLTIDRMRSISSRNGKLALAVPDVVDLLVKESRENFSHQARQGLFADVGIDLSITRAQPTAQGNDISGYKVTLSGSTDYKRAIYVVKEDGHYQVLATSRFPAAIGLEVLDRVAANDMAGARVLLDWLRDDQHLAGGDDPVSGYVFPRFWMKGQEGNAAQMKLAAASILADYKETAIRGLTTLEAARQTTLTDSEKINVLLALLDGYDLSSNGDYAKNLAICGLLATLYPESRLLFLNESFDLSRLGRFTEADNLAEERLKRIPGDIDAMRAEVLTAKIRADYVRARAITQNIIDAGKAQASDLNSFAWDSLFLGKIDPADIDAALKATQLAKDDPSKLNTLGCLYAAVGKTSEARDVLLQAMDLQDLDEPNADFWYAFGLIAEQYGESPIALADYGRVTKPINPEAITDSSFLLAQSRIKALRSERP